MIGGLPLDSTLKRRGLGLGTWFFCTIPLEGSTHKFIKCHITRIILKYLSNIWQILTRYLRPQKWVFSQYVQNGPHEKIGDNVQISRYWGLQHNWNMRNVSCLIVDMG